MKSNCCIDEFNDIINSSLSVSSHNMQSFLFRCIWFSLIRHKRCKYIFWWWSHSLQKYIHFNYFSDQTFNHMCFVDSELNSEIKCYKCSWLTDYLTNRFFLMSKLAVKNITYMIETELSTVMLSLLLFLSFVQHNSVSSEAVESDFWIV